MSTTTIGEFSTWHGTPEGLHANNLSFLENAMSHVLLEIEEKSSKLDGENLCDFNGLEEVTLLYRKILDNYTFEIANSYNNEPYIRNNINTFNEKVLKIKSEIQTLILEQEMISKDISDLYKNIDKTVEAVCRHLDIDDTNNEISKLMRKVQQIKKLSSKKEQLEQLTYLKNISKLLPEVIKYQLEIDALLKELINSSLISASDKIIIDYYKEFEEIKSYDIVDKRIPSLKGLHNELSLFIKGKQKEAVEIQSRIEKIRSHIEKISDKELFGRNEDEYLLIKEKNLLLNEIPIYSEKIPLIKEIAHLCSSLSHDLEIAELVGPIEPIQLPERRQFFKEQYDAKMLFEMKKIIEDINRTFERLSIIDEEEGKKNKSLIDEISSVDHESVNVQRLYAINLQLQNDYCIFLQKIADAKIIHSELEKIHEELLNDSESDFLKRVITMKEKKYPEMSEYQHFLQDYLNHKLELRDRDEQRKATEEALNKITDELSSLGYSLNSYTDTSEDIVTSLINKNPVYYDTSINGHAIMLQLNNAGRLVFKFLRIIADEKARDSITRTNEIAGLEEAKKWCQKYEIIKNKLNEKNNLFIETMRVEPKDHLDIKVIPEYISQTGEQIIHKTKNEEKLKEKTIG